LIPLTLHQRHERVVPGEFVKGHRESMVLATKYTNSAPGTDPNAGAISAEHDAVGRSQSHGFRLIILTFIGFIFGTKSPRWRKSCGGWTIWFAGEKCSMSASPTPGLWNRAGEHPGLPSRLVSLVGLQIEYSLMERTVERELIPMAKSLKLGVTAWSPLSNGVLTGKYHGNGSSDPRHEQRHDEAIHAEEQKPGVLSQPSRLWPDRSAAAWRRWRCVAAFRLWQSSLLSARASSRTSGQPRQFRSVAFSRPMKALDEAIRLNWASHTTSTPRIWSRDWSMAGCATRLSLKRRVRRRDCPASLPLARATNKV